MDFSGTVTFSGLVRDEGYQTGGDQMDAVDLSGTIEFTCDEPTARALIRWWR